MSTQVRLNLYERGIVTSLAENYGYQQETARQLVVRYIKVIRKLGGYDSCYQHAGRLVQASNTGYTPEEWLQAIKTLEHEELLDEGISERETRSGYANV